jgi:hypothetical protein
MSRRRVAGAKDLKILSTVVSKRDGPRRVEAAPRQLFGAILEQIGRLRLACGSG